MMAHLTNQCLRAFFVSMSFRAGVPDKIIMLQVCILTVTLTLTVT